MKKLLNKYLLYYILSIIVFGCIYYLFWMIIPGSFIFNKELNLNPFVEEIKWNSNQIDQDLTSFAKRAAEIQKEYKSVEKEYKKTQERYKILKQNLDSLLELNMSNWAENSDKYVEKIQNQSEHFKRLIEVRNKIQQIKNVKFDNKIDSLESIVLIASLVADSSRVYVNFSEEILKVMKFTLSNMSYFHDPNIIRKIDSLEVHDKSYYKAIYSLEDRMSELKIAKRELKYDYYRATNERLNFFDFIYFSSANASTVTYGEIVPNNFLLRLTIMVQVIVCLVIFGGYVNKIFD